MSNCYVICLFLCFFYTLVSGQFGYQNHPHRHHQYGNYDNYNNYGTYQREPYGDQGEYENTQNYYGRRINNNYFPIRHVGNQWPDFNNYNRPRPNFRPNFNNFNNVQTPQFEDRFNGPNPNEVPPFIPERNSNEASSFPPQENKTHNNFFHEENTFTFPSDDQPVEEKTNYDVKSVDTTTENPLTPAHPEPPTTPASPPEIPQQTGLTHIVQNKPEFESRNNFNNQFFTETCNTVDGGFGTCISILNCQQYVALLQQGQNQNTVNILRRAHCGFDGNTPKVCCPLPGIPKVEPPTPPPPPPEPKTQAPVTENPNDNVGDLYVGELPEPGICGVSGGSFTRVVNGVPAKLGDFPWMALLGYRGRRDPNVPRWLCGGSLISGRHVLTAAHCVHAHEEDLYQVRLGELDLSKDDEGATPIDVPIKLQIKHEEYSPTSFTNDIAILVLDSLVQFTDLIKPICLPQTAELKRMTFERYTPFIAGWGDTEFRGPSAPHLQTLQLPVQTNAKCTNAYAAYKAQVIDQRVLCAGYDKGGKDACQGDSGGPLMQPIYNSGTYYFYQIGVVSYGKKCAEPGFPGVYTRVTHFMPWITEKILGKSL